MKTHYSIEFCAEDSILYMELNGFWSTEDGKVFSEHFRSAVDSLKNTPFSVFIDVRQFKPQKPAVLGMMKENIKYAFNHGCQKTARYVSRELTAFQLERLSKDIISPDKFKISQNKKELLAWLNQNNTTHHSS